MNIIFFENIGHKYDFEGVGWSLVGGGVEGGVVQL